jgi:hypothetical protein
LPVFLDGLVSGLWDGWRIVRREREMLWSMATVWTVKGGQRGEYEDRFLEHGVTGGGWEDLPSIEGVRSKEEQVK